MDLSVKPQLFNFKPDRSFTEDLREDLAGIVKMRVCLGLKKNLEGKNEGNWDQLITKPNSKTGYLFANIYHVIILVYFIFIFFKNRLKILSQLMIMGHLIQLLLLIIMAMKFLLK